MLRAARILHNKMFMSVLRSPVLFFDTNPVGMSNHTCIYLAEKTLLKQLIYWSAQLEYKFVDYQ